jgi:hypothetical protein
LHGVPPVAPRRGKRGARQFLRHPAAPPARTLAVLGTGLAGPEQPLEEMHRHALATTAPEDFETPGDLRPPLRTDLH